MTNAVSRVFIKTRVCVVTLARHLFARESDSHGSVLCWSPITVRFPI